MCQTFESKSSALYDQAESKIYLEIDVILYAMHAKRVWIQKNDIESWLRSLGPFGEAFPPISG